MKKIIFLILCFIPWFLGSILFPFNQDFYTSLNLPSFTPPARIFPIVWTILYALIAISIYMVYQKESYQSAKEYRSILTANYILNQLFPFFFFFLKSPFGGFVCSIAVLLSTLFLYYETKDLNVKSAKLLIPYLFWNLFAVILSMSIYFMNV